MVLKGGSASNSGFVFVLNPTTNVYGPVCAPDYAHSYTAVSLSLSLNLRKSNKGLHVSVFVDGRSRQI